jgi:hypothetical protein
MGTGPCPVGQAPSKWQFSAFRRAAFQKPRPILISMKEQRNFDSGAGFCRPVLSARLAFKPTTAAISQIWFRETPGTSED